MIDHLIRIMGMNREEGFESAQKQKYKLELLIVMMHLAVNEGRHPKQDNRAVVCPKMLANQFQTDFSTFPPPLKLSVTMRVYDCDYIILGMKEHNKIQFVKVQSWLLAVNLSRNIWHSRTECNYFPQFHCCFNKTGEITRGEGALLLPCITNVIDLSC